MSKRFGRNQRRQARAEIAALESLYEHQKYKTVQERCRVSDLEREMRYWDDEIIRLLGRHTSFQRTTPEMRLRDIRDFLQVAEGEDDMRAAMRMVDLSGPMASDMTVRVLRMQKLIAIMERGAITLRPLVRLLVMDDKRQVAYAISEDQLQRGMTPRDVEHFAERLANVLAMQFNDSYVPYPKPKKVADA